MPNPIKIYRMVHWSNVQHILQNGLCIASHPLADPNFVAIGHRQLIIDRNSYPVTVGSGGTLSDYIPFYFAGHSPMLLAIKTGNNVVQHPQEDIVFFECDASDIATTGLDYFFTNMNAKVKVAKSFTDINDISHLRWDYINSRYWSNTQEHLGRQDYKQAEFLVKNHLDVNYIDQLWVKNQERKVYFEQIINTLALPIVVNIDVNNHLYY